MPSNSYELRYPFCQPRCCLAPTAGRQCPDAIWISISVRIFVRIFILASGFSFWGQHDIRISMWELGDIDDRHVHFACCPHLSVGLVDQDTLGRNARIATAAGGTPPSDCGAHAHSRTAGSRLLGGSKIHAYNKAPIPMRSASLPLQYMHVCACWRGFLASHMELILTIHMPKLKSV